MEERKKRRLGNLATVAGIVAGLGLIANLVLSLAAHRLSLPISCVTILAYIAMIICFAISGLKSKKVYVICIVWVVYYIIHTIIIFS